ncbi:hypothetical protein DWB77_05177 [Streptomyces hundungensis]|uniref:Uncharacterized protein n=1 Tax=Streptomyces hundungensis TaxID=1077946 RepID=A0A387HGM4_9ACTN|nr:hypothetical protein [Streptomyces hundungensis]AYG82985.1 hypothetical protein DWB77_05177 [Streptomyces hundungensis]
MNANLSLVVTVGDDLVIEEFGRHCAMSQLPRGTWGSGVAQIPAAVAAETARHTA